MTKTIENKMGIADKLLEFYPQGLVLGACVAIVGELGLIIQWNNLDGTKGQKRYKLDEKISITRVDGKYIELSDQHPHPWVHQDFFKGFIRYL